MSLRKILVIVGPEQQRTPALERAVELATRTGATLHLRLYAHHAGIAAVGVLQPEVMRLARHAYVARRESWLESGAAELRSLGIRADVRCTWGGAVEEHVAAEVLELQPDVVIKDVGLDGSGRRLHLDSHEHRLARLCAAPLLLVQPMSRGGPRRIFAAVDPGERGGAQDTLAQAVLQEAHALAGGWRDCAVHAAHSFPGVGLLAWSEESPPDGRVIDALARVRDQQRRRFDELALEHAVPEDQCHFLEGAPGPALAALAANPCHDIVAIGSIQRSGLARFMFGSTTEALLAQACCDVLVVKPGGFRDALLAKRSALAGTEAA